MQVPAAEEGEEWTWSTITADVDTLESCDIREKVGEKEDSVEWDSSYDTECPTNKQITQKEQNFSLRAKSKLSMKVGNPISNFQLAGNLNKAQNKDKNSHLRIQPNGRRAQGSHPSKDGQTINSCRIRRSKSSERGNQVKYLCCVHGFIIFEKSVKEWFDKL